MTPENLEEKSERLKDAQNIFAKEEVIKELKEIKEILITIENWGQAIHTILNVRLP